MGLESWVKSTVIAAHPQDPFERAQVSEAGPGAAAKHRANGDDVLFVSLTTGVVTHAFGIFPAKGEDKLENVQERSMHGFRHAERYVRWNPECV